MPIHVACKNGLPEMFEFLVLQGVDPTRLSEQGRNGWFYAVGTNQFEMLVFLLQQDMPFVVDAKQQTPLHYAAMRGFFRCARLFCQQGVDVEQKNSTGCSAEQVAMQYAQRCLDEGDDQGSQACRKVELYLARLRGEKHVLFKSSASLEAVKLFSLEQDGELSSKRRKVGKEVEAAYDLSVLARKKA